MSEDGTSVDLIPYDRLGPLAQIPLKEQRMSASSSRFSLPALAVMSGLASFVAAPLAAQAVGNSAEFEAWRKVQKEDIDGLREKFMALAKAVPATKLGWRPMEKTRSFHDVFAHVAAEGNTETAMFRWKTASGFSCRLRRRGGPARQAPGRSTDRGHGQVDAEPERHAGRAFARQDEHADHLLRAAYPAPHRDDLHAERPPRAPGSAGLVCPHEPDRATVEQENRVTRAGA
jgi:hypothetical protein